jgi:hypothetical protein
VYAMDARREAGAVSIRQCHRAAHQRCDVQGSTPNSNATRDGLATLG